MKRLALFTLVLILLFVTVACHSFPTNSYNNKVLEDNEQVHSNDDQSASSITVTDMEGRVITIKKPIKRIVVSEWSVAEMVFTVLGEDAVDMLSAVGVTKSSQIYQRLYGEKYPQLANMPEIGGGKASYDPEAIIALEPDVFITNSMNLDSIIEIAEKLEKANIATIIIGTSQSPLLGPSDGVKLIGQIFNREEKAQEVVDFINTQVAVVQDKNLHEREDKPTVYIEKGSGTSEEYDVTFSSGQWATVADIAGGENIATGVINGNSQIDPEYLLSANPDYIFAVGALGFGADDDEAINIYNHYIRRTGWEKLQAVQNKRFYCLSHGHSRSTQIFYPIQYMAKLFYPEEFSELDPEAILREYIERYMLLDYEQGIWSEAFDQ